MFSREPNYVCSSFSLCSDVAAASRLTLSKQLNKSERTGGDHCAQPLKFEQKWQSYLWGQQQIHATKNGDDNERELLYNKGCFSNFNVV